MKDILNDIMQHLHQQVPQLQFIDVNLEQLQLAEPPVGFPCALVDFGNISYTDSSCRSQVANATLTVALGFNVLAPSDINTPESQRAMSMAHYEIVEDVSDALHGYCIDGLAPFSRQGLQRAANTYPRHYILTFATSWTEDNPSNKTIHARPAFAVKA